MNAYTQLHTYDMNANVHGSAGGTLFDKKALYITNIIDSKEKFPKVILEAK